MMPENSVDKIDRNDITTITHHSNLSQEIVQGLLEKNVFNDADAWKKFLHLFFIVLGVGFMVTGIIFFFAYNWEILHKFAKMGILEVLVVATTLSALFFKLHVVVKKSILTGAAMLVGALFAVYGQIYQTGANAYDFFLAWTFAITIWAFAVNFAPLWLLHITLLNTTLFLYLMQVAPDIKSFAFVCLLFFVLNISILFLFIYLKAKGKRIDFPVWLRNILVLVCVCCTTVGLSEGIQESSISLGFTIFLLLAIIIYIMGIRYGKKTHSIFFYAIIALSMLCFASSLMLRVSDADGMILFISFLDIVGTTMLIKYFFKLQKEWAQADAAIETDDVQTIEQE